MFEPENGWLKDNPFLSGNPIFRGELLVLGGVIHSLGPNSSHLSRRPNTLCRKASSSNPSASSATGCFRMFQGGYTPQNKHGTWKLTLGKGDSYSKPSFPGSMLVIGGVFPAVWHCFFACLKTYGRQVTTRWATLILWVDGEKASSSILEDHPMTCKWLITMVIGSPLRIGLWDPFQMAYINGL